MYFFNSKSMLTSTLLAKSTLEGAHLNGYIIFNFSVRVKTIQRTKTYPKTKSKHYVTVQFIHGFCTKTKIMLTVRPVRPCHPF
jgi:hypothetical protein